MIASGDWPQITLHDGTADGKVTLSFHWTDYSWRDNFEKKAQEFEIAATGTEPTDLNPEKSKVTVRLAFKVLFIRNCVIGVPDAPQAWDNTANGGSATDTKIIYKLSDGPKVYSVAPTFRHLTKFLPGDKKCWIRWSLVYEGTDTSVITDFGPQLSIIDTDDDGNISIKLAYTTQKYRTDYEVKNPTFEIVALGYEPVLLNPEVAAVAARLPVKIEFIRDCSAAGAKMNLPGGEIILLK